MRRTAVLVPLLLIGAACGSGGGTSDPSASPTHGGKRPTSTGVLTIVAPVPGSQVPPDDVTVRVKLEGARVVKETSTVLTPDTGHIHIRLDGKTLSLLSGETVDLVELNGGPLTPGQHLLEVEFVAADHGFFDPRVVQTTTFVVTG